MVCAVDATASVDVTRFAIVDDHPVFREGLGHMVDGAADFALTLTAASVEDYTARSAAASGPGAEIVILDLGLPGLSGAEAVDHMCQLGLRVLVVSADGQQDAVVDAIGAGAAGYLTKAADPYEIVVALREIARGGTYVSPTLASFLVRAQRKDAPDAPWALTPREREVLAHVAEGSTDAEIATTLFISMSTVRGHLDRVRNKTGLRRRAQLALLGVAPRPRP